MCTPTILRIHQNVLFTSRVRLQQQVPDSAFFALAPVASSSTQWLRNLPMVAHHLLMLTPLLFLRKKEVEVLIVVRSLLRMGWTRL